MADYMDDIDVFVTEDTKAAELKAKQIRKRGSTQQYTFSKKRVDEIEIINRNKALKEPIPSKNAGYKLLQKFGFSADEGKGEDGANEIAHSHITNNLRGRSHAGIGIAVTSKASEMEMSLQAKDARSKEQAQAQLHLTNGFLDHQKKLSISKDTVSDLNKAQKAIYELDIRKDIEEHSLWPAIYRENSGVDDGHDDVYSDEKRGDAILYLRKVHMYCLYCGCAFESEEDLSTSCPGRKDDH